MEGLRSPNEVLDSQIPMLDGDERTRGASLSDAPRLVAVLMNVTQADEEVFSFFTPFYSLILPKVS